MKQNNNTFKDDIERAERALLIYSWVGVISALAIMGYSFWSLA
tara:strand:+ start:464 stop:592 length:129 start_codon:yes stop_codon:yes gene_type:complete